MLKLSSNWVEIVAALALGPVPRILINALTHHQKKRQDHCHFAPRAVRANMLLNQVSADNTVVLVCEALKYDRDLLVDPTVTIRELTRLDFRPVEPFMDLYNRFTEGYQAHGENKDWGFELTLSTGRVSSRVKKLNSLHHRYQRSNLTFEYCFTCCYCGGKNDQIT